MSLHSIGITANQDKLVSQVYVPQRKGSLQVEMLAGGCRNGAFSMTTPPRLHALLEETAAGNPVIVLQNLGLAWLPIWHYALVIGYDLSTGEIVLRSGKTERLTMSLSTFEHTWARSHYWGMVTLLPGNLPATATEGETALALAAFEKDNSAVLARKTYHAALQH